MERLSRPRVVGWLPASEQWCGRGAAGSRNSSVNNPSATWDGAVLYFWNIYSFFTCSFVILWNIFDISCFEIDSSLFLSIRPKAKISFDLTFFPSISFSLFLQKAKNKITISSKNQKVRLQVLKNPVHSFLQELKKLY